MLQVVTVVVKLLVISWCGVRPALSRCIEFWTWWPAELPESVSREAASPPPSDWHKHKHRGRMWNQDHTEVNWTLSDRLSGIHLLKVTMRLFQCSSSADGPTSSASFLICSLSVSTCLIWLAHAETTPSRCSTSSLLLAENRSTRCFPQQLEVRISFQVPRVQSSEGLRRTEQVEPSYLQPCSLQGSSAGRRHQEAPPAAAGTSSPCWLWLSSDYWRTGPLKTGRTGRLDWTSRPAGSPTSGHVKHHKWEYKLMKPKSLCSFLLQGFQHKQTLQQINFRLWSNK